MWKYGRAVFKHSNTQRHCPTYQTAVQHSTLRLQQKNLQNFLVLTSALHMCASGRWCGPDRWVPGKLVVPKTQKSQTNYQNGNLTKWKKFQCKLEPHKIPNKGLRVREKEYSGLIPLPCCTWNVNGKSSFANKIPFPSSHPPLNAFLLFLVALKALTSAHSYSRDGLFLSKCIWYL